MIKKRRIEAAIGMSRTRTSLMQGKSGCRVAVGMSGGVDSSLAAALLVEQGCDVTGVHLQCWEEPGCSVSQDRKDAIAVALQLDIPFKVLDFQKQYQRKVIDYFYSEYQAGRTPNPDVMCNLEIKFGLFLKWAMKNGFDYVATGHYARIRRIRNKPIINSQFSNKFKLSNSNDQTRLALLRGVDEKKDQSYFLYRLSQKELKHVMFPIGEMTKEQVRREAKKRKLFVWDKKDSTGICFVGDVNVRAFLKKKIKERKGEVVMVVGGGRIPQQSGSLRSAGSVRDDSADLKSVSAESNDGSNDHDDKYLVVGEHVGVWFYTIGQRHGFKIRNYESGIRNQGEKKDRPPLYVVSKDVARNRLIVGTEEEAMRDEFEVGDVHWVRRIRNPQTEIRNLKVRIRHGGVLIPAKLERIRNPSKKAGKQESGIRVFLKDPAFGVASGQSAVFYKGDECLGGGVVF